MTHRDHTRDTEETAPAGSRLLDAGTVAACDLPRLLAGWGSASWRAAALVVGTLGPKPLEVRGGYPALEAPVDWSSREKLRMRLASSLVDGDLARATESFDDADWAVLLGALAVAYDG